MKKILITVLISFCFVGIAVASTYQEYYEYSEKVFYYNHIGSSYRQEEKDNFCLKLSMDLYGRKVDLKKLEKEMHDNDAITRFGKVVPFKQEYREWAFVNRKGLLRANIVDNGRDGAVGGYSLDEDDVKSESYNGIYEGWFKRYITLEALEKKWKGKPAPKGYEEFITKYRCINF